MLPDFIALECLYYFVFPPRWKQHPKNYFILFTAFYLYIISALCWYWYLLPIIIHLPNIFSGFSSEINFHPFINRQLQRGSYLTESLLNISLFIPFGFLIHKNVKLTPIQTILTEFLFSTYIEILQPLLSFDRVSDISDVITNTIGTCIGAYLYQMCFFNIWIVARMITTYIKKCTYKTGKY